MLLFLPLLLSHTGRRHIHKLSKQVLAGAEMVTNAADQLPAALVLQHSC